MAQELLIEGNPVAADQASSLGEVLKGALSSKKYKSAIAVRVDGKLFDLSASVADLAACSAADNTALTLEVVTAHDPDGLHLLRHSVSHIMAAAVQKLWPEAQVTIGPAIDNGFYYDFDTAKPFSPDDLEKIEQVMAELVKADLPFIRTVLSKKDAIALFAGKNEPYKVEIISDLEIGDDDLVSLYSCGDFVDLCRGPHLPSTGKAGVFKLMSVAGAYWRGDENKAVLSRIYGTAFADEKELKQYLHQLEEARKRDHRKLGKELGLFSFHEEVAPGMSFWLPKGMLLRVILEDFLRREHLKRGYQLVQGPQIMRRELWERSGHYDNYRENMYFTDIEGDVHGVKPMNCLGHMLMYNETLHSYRELPVRLFELGVVHRHEKSGVLHGLLRVRQFTQDDAHIICTPEQLEDEIIGVMDLSAALMDLFGFTYKIFISTMPEKHIGSDEDWERATQALIQAVEKKGKPYSINHGDGAFYGPKIDVKVLDALGREWQLSTIQVDFTMPERFDLTYVGVDGERHRPVMVHRAILGSLERFIGVLTEHFAGAFPTWLAPTQAILLNVTDAQADFTRQAQATLAKRGLRVDLDLRNEKLGFKVRQAQLAKVPFILVVGDKEVEAGGVNVRLRNGDNLGLHSLDQAYELIRADEQQPFSTGGMSYSFA